MIYAPYFGINIESQSIILVGFCLGAVVAASEPKNTAMVGVISQSRQFIVAGVPIRRAPDTIDTARAERLIRLDPNLLAISCEHIKQSLLSILGVPDQWRGRIHVSIQFTPATNTPVVIQPTYYADGWQYRLAIPDEVGTNKLAQAIVHVLLLEMANRHAGPRLAEIPLWLSEGFSQYLLMGVGRNLLVRPFSSASYMEIRMDPLRVARLRLRSYAPLSFTQLSLPTPDLLQGANWESFRACSHLLLAELLRLEQGRADLWQMVQRLPERLNWQLTFLEAFREHFRSLLEVEKWWALVLANVTGRVDSPAWSLGISLDKLDQILGLPAQIRESTNAPAYSALSLQQFIQLWDFPTQQALLTGKLQQLRGLRLQAAPSLVPLVEAYQTALETYLRRRRQAGYEASRGLPPAAPRTIVRETSQELEGLDARRAAWRRRLAASTPAEPLEAVRPRP